MISIGDMNTIRLKSIAELVRDAGKSDCNHYLIEGYQRGYRWQSGEYGQVLALLRDVKAFIDSRKYADEIYCLQPIVVVGRDDGQWEVIDGQQRLTTIYLILKCLGSEELFTIDYTYRKDSTTFLSKIETLVEGIDNNPDYLFMSKAYKAVKGWLEEENRQAPGFKYNFTGAFLNSVQVIWYEVSLQGTTKEDQEREKIEIFSRLNIGKIPLDDAELIRALFIAQLSVPGNPHEEVLLQSIFASEWQEIERFLTEERVWHFLHFGANDKPRNRILKLFELATCTKSGKQRLTFLHYERLFRESADSRLLLEELWGKVKCIHAFIASCFAERELYHRVGLCLTLHLLKLEELALMHELSKKSFRGELEKRIKGHYDSIDTDKLGYDGNAKGVQDVLLLFNVLSLEEMADVAQNRFPFELYNQDAWSLEHIHAQQSEEIKDRKQIKDYLSYALKALDGVHSSVTEHGDNKISLRKIKEEMSDLLKSSDEGIRDVDLRESFGRLRSQLETLFSSGRSLHGMDNMALLSCGNNAALSNAIFPIKRYRMLELERKSGEREPAFIPPCTKAVFLKVYSPIGSIPYIWGEEDRKAYLKEMNRILPDYIQIPYQDLMQDNRDGE